MLGTAKPQRKGEGLIPVKSVRSVSPDTEISMLMLATRAGKIDGVTMSIAIDETASTVEPLPSKRASSAPCAAKPTQ
jgi:hypothetical protein